MLEWDPRFADHTEAVIPVIATIDHRFPFVSQPGARNAVGPADDTLGPLALLEGTWEGNGYNTIWRPHFPLKDNDRFLELDVTKETLAFSVIGGAVPNRGLFQPDIMMYGLTYMQQVVDPSENGTIHIETGIWMVVPQTSTPDEPASVVRMASIPHGTAMLAQGVATTSPNAPTIEDINIIPFHIGTPRPPNSDFPEAEVDFPELDLATPTPYRRVDPGVTEAMVANPNLVLQQALAPVASRVTSTTTLQITSTGDIVEGGGTANTAFLQVGNADATAVAATFWIETLKDPSGGPDQLQLQYSQTVMLDFNGLHWPHVSVATLTKQAATLGG